MAKLDNNEIDDLLKGVGLIEIEIDDPITEAEVFEIMKRHGGFIATKEGTYMVSEELLQKILNRGYAIREIKER